MNKNEWLDIVLIAGFAQGGFLSFVLWKKESNNKKAVNYLTAAIALVAFLLLGRATFQPMFVQRFAEIIMLPDVILFLLGPLIYFFVLSLLRQPLPPTPKRYLHYLPAFIHVAIVNTVVGLNLKGVWSFMPREVMHWCMFGIEAAGIISFTVYMVLSYREYLKYKDAYHEKFAVSFSGNLLYYFFVFSFSIAACWTVGFIYNYTLSVPTYLAYYIVWSLLCILVYFLAYQVYNSPSILQLPDIEKDTKGEQPVIEGIDRNHLEKLLAYMEEEKPYLDQELRLDRLAELMNMPRYELSKLINQGTGNTYFDFVNRYRVNEYIALRENVKYDHLNILELAFQSGFNSKSAFNRAFRKHTGQSPTDFFMRKPEKTGQKTSHFAKRGDA